MSFESPTTEKPEKSKDTTEEVMGFRMKDGKLERIPLSEVFKHDRPKKEEPPPLPEQPELSQQEPAPEDLVRGFKIEGGVPKEIPLSEVFKHDRPEKEEK